MHVEGPSLQDLILILNLDLVWEYMYHSVLHGVPDIGMNIMSSRQFLIGREQFRFISVFQKAQKHHVLVDGLTLSGCLICSTQPANTAGPFFQDGVHVIYQRH